MRRLPTLSQMALCILHGSETVGMVVITWAPRICGGAMPVSRSKRHIQLLGLL